MKKKNVLVVDDSIDFRDLVATWMNKNGLVAHSVANAEEALKCLSESGRFDLIVSDNQMPNKSGIEFFAELSADGNQIPFILMSGSAALSREDVIDTGMSDFLVKPFSEDVLMKAVRAALNPPLNASA